MGMPYKLVSYYMYIYNKCIALFPGNSDSPSGTANVKRKKVMSVVDVFNQENDDSSNGAKKRKLVPLDYDKDDKKPTTAEEKRQLIKRLIDQIPTGKEELFAYSLDWSTVDQVYYCSTDVCGN